MIDLMASKRTADTLVPITRFDRGEAGKIFDEVKESGYKIVVKNNAPACVLLTPERYEKMVEMIIDQQLYALAEERLKNWDGKSIPAEEVYKDLGIEPDDDDDIPMEYGVDWE